MFLKFIKNAFVLLAATSVAVQPVLAQAIVGDGGVNSPAVVQAANGVDIVQINAPNIDGVSHNTYEDFDIGPDGVILNNSNGNYVLTNLGGYIAGNPNVVGTGPARIIINETTSSNPSQIDGYIEVGGARADVIVANPNGINCNGCGFINTDRAVLTTGTPTYTTAGSFEGFNVEQGTIVIGQGGANASGVSQFDLIARNVTFNGTVQGQRVRVIAGRNNVIFATGDTTAMADDGSGVGEVAIDSTVFGGMYANKITIVSTNQGAGVTAPRNMAAGAGGMHISSNGRLVLGRATSQGAGNLRGKTVVVKKTVRVREALTVEARERLIVEADGIIVSDSAASVSALDGITLEDNAALYAAQSLGVLSDGDFTLNAGASVTSSGDITIAAGSAQLDEGALVYAGVENAAGQTAVGDLEFSLSQDFAAQTAGIYSTGALTLEAVNITVDADASLPATQFVSLGSGSITAGSADLAGSKIYAGGGFDLSVTGGLTTSAGASISAQDALSLSADEFVLIGTLIQSADQIDLNATGTVQASATQIVASGDVAIEAGAIDLQDGQLFANDGDVTLEASGIIDVDGTVAAGGAVAVTADAQVDLSGTIAADGGIAVFANGITNDADILSGLTLSLTSTGAITTNGDLTSLGAVTVTADGGVRQTGAVRGAQQVAITGAQILNSGTIAGNGQVTVEAVAGTVTSTGALDGGAGLTVLATGDLTTTGPLTSGGDVVLTSGADLSQSGTVEIAGALVASAQDVLTFAGTDGAASGASLGALSLTGAGVEFTGDVIVAGDGVLSATAGDLTQSGQLTTGQALALQATGAVRHEGDSLSFGALSFDGQGVILTGSATSLAGATVIAGIDGVTLTGTIQTNSELQFTTTAGLDQSATGVMSAATGDLVVTAAMVDLAGISETGGDFVVTSDSDIALAAGSVTYADGMAQMTAQDALSLDGSLVALAGIDGQAIDGNLTVRGTVRSNNGIDLSAGGALRSYDTADVFSYAGGIRFTGSTADPAAVNGVTLDGTITSNDAIEIAGNYVSLDGDILGGQTVSAEASLGQLSVSGTVTTGLFEGNAATNLSVTGDIQATAALSAGDLVYNGGVINGHGLAVSSAEFVNGASGVISQTQTQTFNVTDRFLNAGEITGDADIVVASGGVANNTGTLDATGQLRITADTSILNLAGAGLEGGSVVMLSGDVTNQGSVLSESVLLVASGLEADGATPIAATEVRNSGQIQAHGSVYLAAEGLTNSGEIGGFGGLVSLTDVARFDNTNGEIYGQGLVALETSDDLDLGGSTWGTVVADGTLSLAGIDGAAMGALSIGSGVEFVSTGGLELNVASLDNAGTLASATGNVVVTSQGDIVNSGLIYAGGDWVALRTDATVTNDGGHIIGANNLVICGAGSDNCLDNLDTDRAAAVINKNGGVIETFNGDITIAADLISNERTAPTVTSVERAPVRIGYRDSGGSGCSGTSKRCDTYTKYEVVTENVVTEGPEGPAMIISGGDINLHGTDFVNSYSLVSASEDITLDLATAQNHGVDVGQSTSHEYEHYVYIYKKNWRRSTKYYDFGLINHEYFEGGDAHQVFGTIEAGGSITGTVTGFVDNGAVTANDTDLEDGLAQPTVTGATAGATQTAGSVFNASDVAIAGNQADVGGTTVATNVSSQSTTGPAGLVNGVTVGIDADAVLPFGTAIGGSSFDTSSVTNPALFTVTPGQTTGYLIETRHEFVDLSMFLSSDYFLGLLDFDPEITHTRLGDAMVETYVIRDQLYELTGSRFVDGDGSEADRIRGMYDNAAAAADGLQLRPGVSLTDAQVSALTDNIIWLEEAEVNGQVVLVPRVYLASDYTTEGGAIINASSVDINVGSFTNQGNITADDLLVINAAGSIVNDGGSIAALGDLQLASAAGSVLSYGGEITGDNVTLAGMSVGIITEIHTLDGQGQYNQFVGATSQVTAASDLTILGQNGVQIAGADIAGGNDVAISSLGAIHVGAVDTVQHTDLSGYEFIDQDIYGSSLTALDGNLTITSGMIGADGVTVGGGDVTLESVSAFAGGDIGVTALDGTVWLSSVAETDYEYSYVSSSGFLSSSSIEQESLDVTWSNTNLSGDNINVLGASGVVDMASVYAATGTMSVESLVGDVSFESVVDIHASNYSESNSFLWGLLGSSSEESTLQTTAHSVLADAGTDINLFSGGDLTVEGGLFTADGTIRTEVAGTTSLYATVDTDFFHGVYNDNNGITITDTTVVDITQSATFTGFDAASVELDTDTDINVGLQGTQAGIASVATTLLSPSGEDTQAMALLEYYLPDATGPPIAGNPLGTAVFELTSSPAGDDDIAAAGPAPTGGGNPALDLSASSVAIGVPGAQDGAQFAYLDTFEENLSAQDMFLVEHHYYDEQVTLNPAFQALLTIAVGYYMPTITLMNGSGFAATAINAGAQAFVKNLVVGTISGAITGDLDLGAMIESAALSGLSGGLTAGISEAVMSEITGALGVEQLSNESLLGFSGDAFSPSSMVTGFVNSSVSAGVNSIIYGTDFSDALSSGVMGVLATEVTTALHNVVGDMVQGPQNPDGIFANEGSAGHAIAHGIAGCVAAVIQDADCGAGAVAGIAASLYSGAVDGTAPDPETDPEAYQKWRAETLKTANMIGGVVGYVFSGGEAANVNAAAGITSSGVENNYLTHEEVQALRSALQNCGQDQECLDDVYGHYAALSMRHDQEFANCEDSVCFQHHLKRAKGGEAEAARINLEFNNNFDPDTGLSANEREFSIFSGKIGNGPNLVGINEEIFKKTTYKVTNTPEPTQKAEPKTVEEKKQQMAITYCDDPSSESCREKVDDLYNRTDRKDQVQGVAREVVFETTVAPYVECAAGDGISAAQACAEITIDTATGFAKSGVATGVGIVKRSGDFRDIYKRADDDWELPGEAGVARKTDDDAEVGDDAIRESDAGDLYRGDGRQHEKVFEDGLVPWDPDGTLPLEVHVNSTPPPKVNNPWVSTSTNAETATDFAKENDGNVYVIDSNTPGGVHVDGYMQDIGIPQTYPNESEIAFPGVVTSCNIKGCFPALPNGTLGDFIPNPNYSGQK